MNHEITIKIAKFNSKVCIYWLFSVGLAMTVSVIGIPLLFIWIPVGLVVTRKYLDSMECILTNKALKVRKGIFIRIEKTIPLDKITDMSLIEGPIMRHFELNTLTVETAGQSGVGALVSLSGIINAREYREAVLKQRDELTSIQFTENKSQEPVGDKNILLEIRDSLLRIEKNLDGH
ncbi:MAG: hypothetical protein COA79_23250 [Planctomycetota bacterium]|nr:MAG: hypothetical protein COA79_23250 [Planctomycetota bacterium]